MNWKTRPELSQEHMENYYHTMMIPGSTLQHHGVIPKMEPCFVGCDFEKGTSELAYTVLDWELNPEDMIHGGITSTALDTSMGMLAHYYMQKTVVTITINVSFLKPILLGDTFHIRCQLDSLGRTLATVKAEVRLERDDLLAGICTATFMAVNE